MPLDKGGLYDVVRAQFPELNDHSFYRRWAAVHYAAQRNEVFEWDTERGVADDPANIPNLPPRVPVAEAARRLDDDLVWPAGTTRTIGALGKNANLRTVDVYDAIWDVLREDGRAISEGYRWRRTGARGKPGRTTADGGRVTVKATYAKQWAVKTSREQRQAQAREADLVRAYVDHVTTSGLSKDIAGWRYAKTGGLIADLYDFTRDILIEAKASATREDVRMAVGQLLDYRRHQPVPNRVAVLLPNRPSAPIIDYLADLKIDLIYHTHGGEFLERFPIRPAPA